MPTTSVSFRVDTALKKEAEELFQDFGLSMNSAFNMFLKQAVREQGIPFVLTRNVKETKRLIPSKTIQDRFAANPTAFIEDAELDWGENVGEEVW